MQVDTHAHERIDKWTTNKRYVDRQRDRQKTDPHIDGETDRQTDSLTTTLARVGISSFLRFWRRHAEQENQHEAQHV